MKTELVVLLVATLYANIELSQGLSCVSCNEYECGIPRGCRGKIL